MKKYTEKYYKFKERCTRLIIQDMKDGCGNCNKKLCRKHEKEAMKMICNPRGHAELQELLKNFNKKENADG